MFRLAQEEDARGGHTLPGAAGHAVVPAVRSLAKPAARLTTSAKPAARGTRAAGAAAAAGAGAAAAADFEEVDGNDAPPLRPAAAGASDNGDWSAF